MKAIIPMAGSGTRLRPLTYSKPKSLLHVGSKPIICHIVDSLLTLDCRKLVLIISRDSVNVPDFIRKEYPEMEIETVIQEERLGLGHAVELAENSARGEDVIVMYGDTIIADDLTGILDMDADGVIAVKVVEDPSRFGVVEENEGIISRFVEKPSEPVSNLAIVGFNYFRDSDALFDSLKELISSGSKTKGEFQITDAFQLMVGKNIRMKAFPIEHWFDCGTPETLLETNRYMLAVDGNTNELPGSIIIPPVFIHPKARVHNSIIGPNVSIGKDSHIERSIITDSIIGSNSRVVYSCIRSSLIGDNAQVTEKPHKLFIGDNSSLAFSIPDPDCEKVE